MHIQNRILVGTVNNKYAYENLHYTIERGKQTYITIHESSLGLGTTPADRTIDYYENRLLNPDRLKGEHELGYHFMVSDKEVVQFISTKFRTAHAGCFDGNSSIAIQRVVNCKVDFYKAICNQAKLAATLMFKFNIGYKHLVPRSYWGNSESPTRLNTLPPTLENIKAHRDKVCHIPGNKTWSEFSDLVAYCYLLNDIFDVNQIL